MKTWLTCIGDASNPATFGGFPFHLVEVGRKYGVIDAGLPLNTDDPKIRFGRVRWTLGQILRGIGRGGYQYTESFLDRLWSTCTLPEDGDTIINKFQLYSKCALSRPGRRYFYIDQTLHSLFHYYRLDTIVPDAVQQDAIAREKDQYLSVDKIFCESAWAATDLITRYGISTDKVVVVLPGANLDPMAVAHWESQMSAKEVPMAEQSNERPLHMLFVGREWKRKGLDRLLRGLEIARSRGAKAELSVVGAIRDDMSASLCRVEGVNWLGRIDKFADPSGFVSLVASADLGCLLSRREAGGISLREFARLGVPVIAPNTGGAPEYNVSEAAFLVSPDDTDESIAEIICKLDNDRELVVHARQAAWSARYEADWSHSVRRMAEHLDVTVTT